MFLLATTVSFDSPKSSTAYPIQTTGTVAANSTVHVMIKLAVTNTGSHPRSDSYYKENDYTNATFTDTAVTATFSMAITPKLFGTDTVQASAAWSY